MPNPTLAPRTGAEAREAEAPNATRGAEPLVAWLAVSLRGVTWPRVGLFLLLMAILAAGSTPTARAIGYGSGLARIAGSFLGTFVPMAAGYGMPMLALVAVANRTAPRSRVRMFALVAVVVLGSAVAAVAVALSAHLTGVGLTARFYAFWIESMAELAAVSAVWLVVSRRDANREALERVQLARMATDRRLTEARVLTLQAQIEPHFLFNTLANVRRLLQTDRAAGRAMVRQLIHYLQATLPALRDARSSLGRELALVVAYLDVQRIRMGARLQAQIDVPAAVRDARFPPMMLMTLVENAIKHGIGPLPEGGRIAITADALGDRLRVCVRDSGLGIRHTTGKGIGIANTRARLKALYDDAARLSLADGTGGQSGVTATIELPLEFDAEPSPAA